MIDFVTPLLLHKDKGGNIAAKMSIFRRASGWGDGRDTSSALKMKSVFEHAISPENAL